MIRRAPVFRWMTPPAGTERTATVTARVEATCFCAQSSGKQATALDLYRRIVLNAAVGHPWNTSLRQTGLGSWALSPLYDVMPFFAHRPPTVMSMALRRGG
jgi:hypothetical protein